MAVSTTASTLHEIKAIREMIAKYHNIPMSLADACLVLLADQHENAAIITTDHDFLIYRTPRRRKLRLIAPFALEAAAPRLRITI